MLTALITFPPISQLTMQRPGRPGGARPSHKNITKEKLISEEPAETVTEIVEEIAAPISNDDAVTEAVEV